MPRPPRTLLSRRRTLVPGRAASAVAFALFLAPAAAVARAWDVPRVVDEEPARRAAALQAGGPDSIRTEDVRYTSADGVQLAALLMVPPGPGPHAAAVIIQGSGRSDRSNAWARALAEQVVGAGVAVLLTDKRGSGASEGDWMIVGFDALADDALAGVAYLRARTDLVDAARVGLIGLSQGGWIAPVAAARSPHIAFVVDVSGAAVGFAEQTLHEMRNTSVQAGLDADGVEAVLRLHRAAGRWMITGDWEAYAAELERASSGPAAPVARGFPQSRDLPIWGFLRAVARFDPMVYWVHVDAPVLVAYGAADEHDNVPVAESVRRLEHGFAAAAKRNYEILVVPGVGHALTEDGRLADAFTDVLRRWLREHALERHGR